MDLEAPAILPHQESLYSRLLQLSYARVGSSVCPFQFIFIIVLLTSNLCKVDTLGLSKWSRAWKRLEMQCAGELEVSPEFHNRKVYVIVQSIHRAPAGL